VRDLPRGTVTLLFTDIDGSTGLLQALGDEYADVLAEHRRALREAFARNNGVEVDTQGDAFFYAFARATDAAGAAGDGQRALAGGPVRVRMGVHTGEPSVTDEGYVGADVHRAARIMSAGHGGQVLLSETTRRLLDSQLELRDLGEHRLKDFDVPERIFQLGDGTFAPLKSLNNTNLPVQLEPLLGRKRELAELRRLIRRDRGRLVTLTGPGGIGKTRLALEVASELVGDFPHGVWFVDLSAVRDPEFVEHAIGAVLGARGDLGAHIGDRSLALVVDNFEQVVQASSAVARLLAACPELVVVVTSREPLHVTGEHDYPLRPLAEAPAVELFRQRAEASAHGFEATYAQLSDVCARLDSLPLAIELAAARAKSVPVEELRQRLESRLPLLSKGRRDAPERQRTLSATIEWSYELLSTDEQEAFALLAVFAGGWTLRSAEIVCEVDLDTLESLVDKSLVRQETGRYSMLETIREYAAKRLEAQPDADGIRRRLASWVLDIAQRAEPGDGDEASLLQDLVVDLANVREALAWATSFEQDRAFALELAASLWRFWDFVARDEEGLRWLAAAWTDDAPIELKKNALRARAGLAMVIADQEQVRAASEERLRLALETDDDLHAAGALNGLATVAQDQGDLDDARRLYLESAERGRAGGAPPGRVLVNLALVERLAGNFGEARTRFQDNLVASRASGNLAEVVWSLGMLAEVAAEEGTLAEATPLLREALETSGRIGYLSMLSSLLRCVAVMASDAGRFETAACLFGAGDAHDETAGGGRVLASWTRTRQVLEDQMSPERFAAAYQEGRTLVSAEAIEAAAACLD
jgi:predicted ATPase